MQYPGDVALHLSPYYDDQKCVPPQAAKLGERILMEPTSSSKFADLIMAHTFNNQSRRGRFSFVPRDLMTPESLSCANREI